ncbi:MAG: DUF4097 family beta strand repeat protein [Sedimentisphaerales bacterium]|nr:DUF4097 family beta strand repeat protein [Sedimentisphaerales bacterium]
MIELINHMAQVWWDWMSAMFWQVGLLIILIATIDVLIRKWAWPQLRYALWSLVLIKLILSPTLSLPSGLAPKLKPVVTKMLSSGLLTEESATRDDLIEFTMPIVIPSADVDDGRETMVEGRTVYIDNTDGPLIVYWNSVDSPGKTRDEGRQTRDEARSSSIGSSIVHRPSSIVIPTGPRLGWRAYLMGVWLWGVVILGTWLFVKLNRLKKEKPNGSKQLSLPESFYNQLDRCAQQLKLRRKPRVVTTASLRSPAVFGVVHPVLLMPAGYLRRLSRRDTEYMLLHELAHIKRGDLTAHSLCMLLRLIYWFNPLLWLVGRQLRHLRELCCDATVASLLRDKTSEYRQTLLETARRFLATPVEPGLGLIGLFEDSNRLIARIQWLKKPVWRYRKMKSIAVITTILILLACVLPMAQGQNPQAQDPNVSSEQAEEKTVQSQTVPSESENISETEQQQKKKQQKQLQAMQLLKEQQQKQLEAMQLLMARLKQIEVEKQQLQKELQTLTQAQSDAAQAEKEVKVAEVEVKAAQTVVKVKEEKLKTEKVKADVDMQKAEAEALTAIIEAKKALAEARKVVDKAERAQAKQWKHVANTEAFEKWKEAWARSARPGIEAHRLKVKVKELTEANQADTEIQKALAEAQEAAAETERARAEQWEQLTNTDEYKKWQEIMVRSALPGIEAYRLEKQVEELTKAYEKALEADGSSTPTPKPMPRPMPVMPPVPVEIDVDTEVDIKAVEPEVEMDVEVEGVDTPEPPRVVAPTPPVSPEPPSVAVAVTPVAPVSVPTPPEPPRVVAPVPPVSPEPPSISAPAAPEPPSTFVSPPSLPSTPPSATAPAAPVAPVLPMTPPTPPTPVHLEVPAPTPPSSSSLPLLGAPAETVVPAPVAPTPSESRVSDVLITEDFLERDLAKDVFPTLSEKAGIPIILEESVKGLITCKLEGVSLDTALDIILAGTPYTHKKTPNYYLVYSRGKSLRPANSPLLTSGSAETVVPAPAAPKPRPKPNRDVKIGRTKEGRYFAITDTHLVSKVNPGSPFVIRNSLGNILLKQSKDDTCDVKAVVRAEAETAEEAQKMAEQVAMKIDSSKEKYYLKPVKPDDNQWSNLSVNLTILVPVGVRPDVKTELGNVELWNLRGKIKAVSDLGSVRVINTSGDLELFTKMGEIVFTPPKDLSARLQAETRMGSIQSDLPLTITKKDMFKRTAEGTIGFGRDTIRMTTNMGSITISNNPPKTPDNNPEPMIPGDDFLVSADKLKTQQIQLEATASKIAATVQSIKEEQEGNRSVLKRVDTSIAPLAPGSVLDTKTQDGNITIQGSDTDQCSITSTLTVKAPSMEEAKALSEKIALETTPGDKKLTVKTVGPRNTPSNHSYYVNLNITVPRNTSLVLHKEDGNVQILNVEGQIQIGSEDGDITCENVVGNVRLDCEDGNATIKKSRVDYLTIRKEDGNIHCDNISGNCDITIEDGNVTIGYAEGSADDCTCVVRGEDGNVNISRGAFAQCQVVRESGNVRCDNVRGNLDINLEKGQVTVDYADSVPESCSIKAQLEKGGIKLSAPGEMFPADAPSKAKKTDEGIEWKTTAGSRTVSLKVDEGSIKVEKR